MIDQAKSLVQALQDKENEAQALIRAQVPDVMASDRDAELLQ